MSGFTTNGWRILGVFLLFPLIFFWYPGYQYHYGALRSVITHLMTPLFSMGLILYHVLFQSDRFSALSGTLTRVPNNKYIPWEFFFSHAIPRRVIYSVRTIGFLIFICLPWVGYMARTCLQPDLQLDVRHDAQAAIDFYLIHFPGAFTKLNPEYMHSYIIVIPHGAILAVAAGFLLFLTFILLYQLCMEVIRNGWLQLGISFGLILLIPLILVGLLSEKRVLWICSNLPWVCVWVIILAVMIQGFCCNRFIRKEII